MDLKNDEAQAVVKQAPDRDARGGFCTGWGQSDTHAETLSDGRPNPHTNAGTPYMTITGGEIVSMVKTPPSVPKKHAQWFIPSSYSAADARAHEAQRARGLFWWLVLDVDENNLPLADILTALETTLDADCCKLIYATRSATADNRKWRALVRLKHPIQGADYSDTVAAFFDLLETDSAGALIPDRKLQGPGQIIYLPNAGAHYENHVTVGPRLDLTRDHPVMQLRDQKRQARAEAAREAQAARERRIVERKANTQAGDVSPMDAFNATHAVADLLGRYGYTRLGQSRDWRSPMQTSTSFATRDHGDFWVSLSGSDAAACIGAPTKNGHRYGDAFDLFVHFEHAGDYGAAVIAYSKEAGLNRDPAGLTNRDRPRHGEVPAASAEPPEELKPLFRPVSEWAEKPVPPREWHVEGLIPAHTVTILGGDGGTGKSLLAQQLAAATALGRNWIGRFVDRPGIAFYLSAEDDDDELHRRWADVARAEGVNLADMKRLRRLSLAGGEPLLAALGRKPNALVKTPLYQRIDREMNEVKPSLLVLDTLADLHAGEENSRTHARQFIGMLRGLAIRHGCTVLLLAHPSLTGMSSGSGLSGSTAWNASVRSRLYMERVVDQGYEADPDVRRLSMKKANYSRTGEEILLRWQTGVFVADQCDTGLDRVAANAKAERVFLKLLDEMEKQGRRVNPAGGQTYAPNVFAANPQAESVTKKAFRTAMETLLSEDRIRIAEEGPPSKRRQFLELAR